MRAAEEPAAPAANHCLPSFGWELRPRRQPQPSNAEALLHFWNRNAWILIYPRPGPLTNIRGEPGQAHHPTRKEGPGSAVSASSPRVPMDLPLCGSRMGDEATTATRDCHRYNRNVSPWSLNTHLSLPAVLIRVFVRWSLLSSRGQCRFSLTA